MIKGIYWDIDECIVHTCLCDPEQEHTSFVLGKDEHYFAIIRPCSKQLIEYSRELVGKENVFILTTSTRDYAQKINEIAKWGFEAENILSRETIADHICHGAYGSKYISRHKFADINNILIDNLPPNYNWDKISMIGIDKSVNTNYLQVRDYYGANFYNSSFEEEATNFLKTRHEEIKTPNNVFGD